MEDQLLDRAAPMNARIGRRRQRVDSTTEREAATATVARPVRSRQHHRSKWLASAALCALMSLTSTHAAPMAITTHVDGVTYCWEADGSVYSSALGDSTPVNEGEAEDCVLTMTLVLDQARYYVNEAFKASWTATVRQDESGSLVENKFGIDQLHVALERITQQRTEIVYARVESCTADATNCDPVIGQTDLAQNVLNQPVNFTDGAASFVTERLAFSTAGDVRIIAHLILPGADPEKKRYDFAMYRTVTISERPTLSATTNSPSESQSQDAASVSEGKGLSTEVICIMFVGGMVAVVLVGLGFTMLRKEKMEQLPSTTIRKTTSDRNPRHDVTRTDVDDEFAMLSSDERLMQSQHRPARVTNNGFLTAAASTTTSNEPSMMEESRMKAKAKIDTHEARSRQHQQPHHHHNNKGSSLAAELASDDHIVDTSTPASMRHDGMYMEMKPALSVPKQSKMHAPPISNIYFNDIQEDAIMDDGSRARKGGGARSNMTLSKVVGPFVDAQSPRGDIKSVADRLRSMPADLEEQKPGAVWRQTSEMTFDDLRESADVGPGLTLDDLLESRKMRKGAPGERDV